MSKFGRLSFSGYVLLLIFAASIFSSSCVSVKKYVYFKDIPDSPSKSIVITETTHYEDPKIETNDLLSITVQPMLQNMTAGGTQGSNSSSNMGSSNQQYIFPVDKNGNIEYSLIGLVKVAGLSTTEARDLIRERSKAYYKDPVVNVRITNFNILILGDVPKPGSFISPNEKVNVLDAIANAGDLNISSRRDNIMLIRSVGDQKICARYDISSKNIFNSPYYYLKQNDIIYVEPNKFKVQSSDQTFIRNLGILSSIISLASLLLVYRSIK